jgi:hypothetical protein
METVLTSPAISDLRLPGFIIAGAPRSGTTWLYHLLDRHPEIAMAKPVRPEPKFFLNDEIYQKGLGHYACTWFAALPQDCLLGEKSTNYLESATAASRIAKDLPGIKLVFMLRDPVTRAWSNYRWTVMNQMENRDFLPALKQEEQQPTVLAPHLRYARPYDYFTRGLYHRMLKPYLDRFPRRDILCLRYEDIGGDRLISTLHDFLGVAARTEDGKALGVINAAAEETQIPAGAKAWLIERYAAPTAELGRLLDMDFSAWRGGA